MKRIVFSIASVILTLPLWSQLPAGFKIQNVDKELKEYSLDSIHLSSPLESLLSIIWIKTKGKHYYLPAISSSRFHFPKQMPDKFVDKQAKEYILNEKITDIITYRDSAAAIITYREKSKMYFLNFFLIEDGQWVNSGQGLAYSANGALKNSISFLPVHYSMIARIAQIKKIPSDIKPFTEYLATVTQTPEEFLLQQLSSHRLVINGEIHRRKVSWDMLKRLISMPDFSQKVGTVFMELPSWCQPKMNELMASDSLNSEIILQIFREEQVNGWWDRGEFEFICDLWHLNSRLPSNQKIKVVLADFQLPYSQLTRPEEWKSGKDRNTHMADVIASTILSSSDTRGNLFLVGCAHAYRSKVSGIASTPHGKEPARTAGAQLADRLGANQVFTVFQHCMATDNTGRNKSSIRGGSFDQAFKLNGNRPVGFKLNNSPFGKEPFDAILEIKYEKATGSYADNYDGYLFLHPIENEPQAVPLTEVFTDEFVEEIKRRAQLMGKDSWFGCPAAELTKEYITERLLKQNLN